MDVVVYRRAREAAPPESATAAAPAQPASRPRPRRGSSARRRVRQGRRLHRQLADRTNRSLVAETTNGYSVASTMNGGVTAPGLTRIDVVKKKAKRESTTAFSLPHRLDERRARPVRSSQALARQRARLHLHEAAALDSIDAGNLTALDFRSGRTSTAAGGTASASTTTTRRSPRS